MNSGLHSRLLHVLLPAIIVLGACQTEANESSGQNPSGSTSAEGPTELIYLDETGLYSYSIADGERSLLAQLPSADVALAPDATHYVVVEETAPGGSREEGFRKPALRIAPMDDAETSRRLGPGRFPVWSPDSAEVGAVARVKGYVSCPFDPGAGAEKTIERADCVTAERIVAYPAAGEGEPEIALGAGDGYSIIGWSGDRRIVAIAAGESPYVVVNSVGASHDDREVVGFAPSEVWGASPAEYTLLIVEDGGDIFFTSPGQGAQPPLENVDGVLGDGTWSPDGGRVATVLLEGTDRAPSASRLVVLDVAGNTAEVIGGSDRAQGNVVWSPDSSSFAYVRARNGKLEAVLCSRISDCRSLFEWEDGITLLGLR